MEIKWIEDFVTLAQCQSFSKAAELRNVTQPGFSRRVKSLEQWIGADLVDRSTYPLSLTRAGRLFREVAEEILAKLYDTRAVIRDQHRMAGVGLQIAAGHTIALNFLPAWLESLTSQFADVRTRVTPTNVHDSILMLANGNCDLMFAYHHPDLPLHLDPAKYEHLTVGIDALIPVCKPKAPNVPLFRLKAGGSQILPFLSYTEASYFGRCVAFLLDAARSKPKLQRHYESDMAELLKKLALMGDGIAWLPRSAIAEELANGDLIAAGGGEWILELALRVYRDTSAHNPLSAKLWRHLQGANAAS